MTITSRQNHFRIVAKHSQKCLVAWTTKMDNRPFGKMSSDDMVIAPPELMQQEIRVNDFRQLWTIEYVDHGDGGMETLSKGKPPRARIVHSGTGHALGDDVVSIVTLPSKESDSGDTLYIYYNIQNMDGFALDVDRRSIQNNAPVIWWHGNGSDNQQWTFVLDVDQSAVLESTGLDYLDPKAIEAAKTLTPSNS
jgi:hypothetical protein